MLETTRKNAWPQRSTKQLQRITNWDDKSPIMAGKKSEAAATRCITALD